MDDHDTKVLVEIAELKKDVANLSDKMDELVDSIQLQWSKIDSHGSQIASLNAKAGIYGTIGGAIMAFVMGLFAKMFRGA